MEVKQRAVLIVNTKSRRGRQWYTSVVETLSKCSNLEILEAHALKDPAEVVRRVKAAVDNEIPLIIVGGGDGTLSSASNFIMGSKSILGVLPLGTGNQFARDLGIVADVETACSVISEGKQVDVDISFVGDSCFLNVATVGLTTLIANEMTNEPKRLFGRFAYAFALAKALCKVRPFNVTLETAEGIHTFDTMQVVIGNGRYHVGSCPLSPDASITDGKQVVYALMGTSRWELLRYASRLPFGKQGDLDTVMSISVSGGKLKASPIQKVTVDGEAKLKTPFTFGIHPGGLRVMVPKDFQGK